MSELTWDCPDCRHPQITTLHPGQTLSCSACEMKFNAFDPEFAHCAVCPCRQFYAQKDFNRGLGCLIVLIGIGFSFVTYGLSLPVCAMIDWLLYRRTDTMVICYRCGGEYRQTRVPARLKPYMHHIGLKYDKYR